MEHTKARLTVFFEDPFWVGMYEREADGQYAVCKITFGPEPKDYEVYQYFLDHWRMLRFSPAIEAAISEERRRNPKRVQREAQRAVQNTGVGTKAQQALQLQREQGKQAHKAVSKAQREAEAERLFALKQEKRKEKHRGH
ncbi:MAG: YjdF family protein [Clostridia bacterium]|nr:YjdF family protein [Clostridia bacterium]